MFIIHKKPNARVEVVKSEEILSLPFMQKLVEGHVRVMEVGDYIVGFNEDGEPLGLEPNCIVGDQQLLGSIFICKAKEGDLASLDAEEIREAIKLVKPIPTRRPKAFGYLTIDFNDFMCVWDSHPPEERRANCEYMCIDLATADVIVSIVSSWKDKKKIMDYLVAEYRFKELEYKF